MGVDELGVRKKKDRTNESFIVVRPPPSKTNHPLNLQVQLVPPSNRDQNRSSSTRSRESSVGQIEDDGVSDVQLTRTSSNRSDVSLYSSYSTTSVSSVTSTSTASSGRRMIIPLYNLQAHSVLTNTIVDAGTDAKVAKFQKRGLEIIGLAVLEPIEVWGEGGNPAPLPGHSPNLGQAYLPDDATPRKSADFARAHTPTSSALSLTSDEMPHPPASATPALLSATPATPGTPTTPRNTPGARKFFGKLFKRRPESPVNSPAFPPSPLPPITAQPPSPEQTSTPLPRASVDDNGRPSRRSSLLLGVTGHSPNPSGSEPPRLQPPVLGIQPSLSSKTYPPRGRPTKYVWIVRKWLKGSPDNIISGMKDKFQSRNSISASAVETMVELRFEWSRSNKKRRNDDRVRTKRHSLALSSAAQSTTSLHQQIHRRKSSSGAAAAAAESRERRGAASMTTATSDEEHKGSPTTTTEDGGDESDPEDSETPWTCTLVVRRLSASRLPGSDGAAPAAGSSTVRVKVAGVVVALLKVPFPLPDIEVERVNVRKRIITPAGVARPATSPERPGTANGKEHGGGKQGGSAMKSFFVGSKEGLGGGSGPDHAAEGLILTAEEIKDVVSSTGFGGVGKVSRKGDGAWRIR
ncbi:hypothetical protein C8Q80DRAFT_1221272 [Daedaleopsis nitida]|nr:hypothetical protein C8Q80DRAFT_1221272 [Daedaleopsis nitida]